MTYYYEGVDCVARTPTDLFTQLRHESRAKISWISNLNYAYYCIYFGVVLTSVACSWYWGWRYSDFQRRNERLESVRRSSSDGEKVETKVVHSTNSRLRIRTVAFLRMIGYYKLPPLITQITGFPMSTQISLLLLSMLVFVVLYAFIPDPAMYYRGCQGFGAPPLAVRSGMMTMGLFPFMLMISGKTNFISGITGVSYERLNIVHQALGWLTFILAWIHTIPFLRQPVKEGGLARLRYQLQTNVNYYNGLPPLIVLCLICLFSLKSFRTRYYEVFVNVHWVLGMAYTALMTWHVWGSMSSQVFVWVSLSFWVVQLIYRGITKTFFKPNSYSFKTKKAMVKLLPNDLFQITIDIDFYTQEFQWEAGQHIFIRFISGLHTLDNHPFSILSLPKLSYGMTQLQLLVKPQGGLTRKIHNLLLSKELDDSSVSLDCYIDGPYGGMSRDVLAFDSLVLIAGGSGITGVFTYLEQAVENFRNNSSCLQRVKLAWAINDLQSFSWIQDQLKEIITSQFADGDAIDRELASKYLKIDVFITNSNKTADTNTASTANIKDQMSQFSDIIKFHTDQKPNFRNYINTDVQLDLPKTCFVVCGNKSLQRDVGLTVSKLQREIVWPSAAGANAGDKVEEIYLHTENFGW
ncbi:hypothetical protein WICPIJ_001949 [Wickerhamomyces pijperi]|uniref:ferric-chelate reductase (NADPH) n=1 Tax=Wickerhamomyces pijperi TaxID=599730 RepID=A0A9P8TQ41_WICPI|nr:hypothetical protein WICPIJ_001949 [Wickerhamomyces pijperi]